MRLIVRFTSASRGRLILQELIEYRIGPLIFLLFLSRSRPFGQPLAAASFLATPVDDEPVHTRERETEDSHFAWSAMILRSVPRSVVISVHFQEEIGKRQCSCFWFISSRAFPILRAACGAQLGSESAHTNSEARRLTH